MLTNNNNFMNELSNIHESDNSDNGNTILRSEFADGRLSASDGVPAVCGNDTHSGELSSDDWFSIDYSTISLDQLKASGEKLPDYKVVTQFGLPKDESSDSQFGKLDRVGDDKVECAALLPVHSEFVDGMGGASCFVVDKKSSDVPTRFIRKTRNVVDVIYNDVVDMRLSPDFVNKPFMYVTSIGLPTYLYLHRLGFPLGYNIEPGSQLKYGGDPTRFVRRLASITGADCRGFENEKMIGPVVQHAGLDVLLVIMFVFKKLKDQTNFELKRSDIGGRRHCQKILRVVAAQEKLFEKEFCYRYDIKQYRTFKVVSNAILRCELWDKHPSHKKIIANHGNFKQACKSLGIFPSHVFKGTLLSYLILAWLYKDPLIYHIGRFTPEESFYLFCRINDCISRDMWLNGVLHEVMETQNPDLWDETIGKGIKRRLEGKQMYSGAWDSDEKVDVETTVDKGFHTAKILLDETSIIQFLSLFYTAWDDYIPTLQKCKTVPSLVKSCVKILFKLCVHKTVAKALHSSFIEFTWLNSFVFKLLTYCGKCLNEFAGTNFNFGPAKVIDMNGRVVERVLAMPSREADIYADVRLPFVHDGKPGFAEFIEKGNELCVFTGFADVFKALCNSEFAQMFKALVSTVKFSIIINSLLRWINPNGVGEYLLAIFEDTLKAGPSLISLPDMWARMINEIIPAFWLGDPSLIAPLAYNKKLEIISVAIAAGKVLDNGMMLDAMSQWKNETVVPNNLYLEFYQVLGEMLDFLTSKHSQHTITIVRTIVNELTIVRQSVYMRVKYGNFRAEPFCIGLHGPPGVGKTTIIETIMYHLAPIVGLTTHMNDDGTMGVAPAVTITDSVKFFDQINNSVEAYTFDDMGVSAPDKVAPGVNAFTTFMQVQANVPFNVNRSDIPSKQNQFFNNKLTFITSNFPDYGSHFFVMDKLAFKRRVHVSLRCMMHDEHDYRSVYYEAECYNSATRSFTIHQLPDRESMLNFVKERAKAFLVARDAHLSNMRNLSLCYRCKRVLCLGEVCGCPIIQEPVENVPALWISELELRDLDNYSFFRQIIFEEAVSQLVYYVVLLLFSVIFMTVDTSASRQFSNLNAAFAAALFRELMEIWVEKEWSLQRFMCMFLCTLLHPVVGFCMHFVYNLQTFVGINYPWFEASVMTKILLGAVTTTSAVCETVSWQFTPQWYIDIRRKMIRVNTNIRDAMSQEIVRKYGLALGFGVVSIPALVFALKAIFSNEEEERGRHTYLGEPSTEADEVQHNKLEDMIGGVNYINDIDCSGKTNSFRTGMHPVHKSAGAMKSSSIDSNMVVIESCLANADGLRAGLVLDTRGVYCDGRIHTVAHMFGPKGKLEDGEVCYVNFYFVKTPHEKFHYTLANGGSWIRYKHDHISFPFQVNRKTVKLCVDYVPEMGDVVCIGDRSNYANVMHVTGECHIPYGGSEVIEPPGGIAVDWQSKEGDSGSPVYICKKKGREVEAMLVGILSRYSQTSNCAVFVPIESITNHTQNILPFIVDAERVQEYFMINEHPIVNTKEDSRSILKHLASTEQIGTYVGCIDRHPVRRKSEFFKTEFYEKACELIPDTKKYTVPDLASRVVDGVYHDPLLSCVREMGCTGQILDASPFWTASEVLFEELDKKLDLDKWVPLTFEDALKGTKMTNPINRKTSVGFPFTGTIKDDLFIGEYEHPRLKSDYAKRIEQLVLDMDEGKPPLNIALSSVKDEIISKEKNDNAQARIFFAGNFEFLLLCRIYLSTLMEQFIAKRDVLFGQIGMNAIGPEFDEFLKNLWLRVHPDLVGFDTFKRWFDGDYKKYDKTLLVLRFAIVILWWLACKSKHFKNNPRDLNRLKLILQSLMQYVVIIGNDVFIFEDKVPSGVWATALINCICEAILEILMFFYAVYMHDCDQQNKCAFRTDFVARYRGQYDVFSCIGLGNYGDDNLKVVADNCLKFYTHNNIQRFARWAHMGMTPARKHETEIVNKSVDDILFLKRVPVYSSILKRYVGRLELSSIGKMLAFTDSKSITWKQAVLDQARRELAFHGQPLYDKFFDMFNLSYIPLEQTLLEIDAILWSDVDHISVVDGDIYDYILHVPCQGTQKVNVAFSNKNTSE